MRISSYGCDRNGLVVASALGLAVTLDIAVSLLFRGIVALVVKLLASAKTDGYLYVCAAEIKRQRNEGKALLRNQAVKLHDLFFVHKKLFLA